jgi:N-acetylglucosamine malate deacetylase 1
LFESKRILVVGPHPDDIELGMGASINKFCRQGARVEAMVLSNAGLSLPTGFTTADITFECISSLGILGVKPDQISFHDFPVRRFSEVRQEILELLVSVERSFSPDFIFCPSKTDCHQDHQVVAAECDRAFRTKSVFGYEFPWNNNSFNPTVSIVVDQADIENKERACLCYESQRHRNYLNPGLLTGLARIRAVATKSKFAESFDVTRLVTS